MHLRISLRSRFVLRFCIRELDASYGLLHGLCGLEFALTRLEFTKMEIWNVLIKSLICQRSIDYSRICFFATCLSLASSSVLFLGFARVFAGLGL